jgi:hypothetical protein
MSKFFDEHRPSFFIHKRVAAKFLSALVGITALSVHGQVIFTAMNVAYTQDFDTLANTSGTTFSILPSGWYLTETGGGARDNEQYAVDTGTSNTGDTYSYGASGSTDRALGGLQSGTLIPTFGAWFVNNTGSTITGLDISYVGELWRSGTAGRTDQLDFQYSLNATSLTTGTWSDVNALDFVSASQTIVGAKDGNTLSTAIVSTVNGLAIADGAGFWMRWTDYNVSGADDGLAVDNLSLTLIPEPTTYTITFGAAALGFMALRRRFCR